jgi:hypothetical protein
MRLSAAGEARVVRLWNTGPGVVPAAEIQAPVGPDAVFAALVGAAQAVRDRQEPSSVSVFVDGALLVADFDELLPGPWDTGPADYQDRLRRILGEREFVCVGDSLHRFDAMVAQAAIDVLDQVTPHVGRPYGGVNVDCFIGTYQATPTGVHKDTAANLSLVLAGTKTMEFWPADAFDGVHRPGTSHTDTWSRSVRQGRRAPTTLTAGPGDLLFWPADWWHCAIDGEGVFTLNISLYTDTPQASRADAEQLLVRHTAMRAERDTDSPVVDLDPGLAAGIGDAAHTDRIAGLILRERLRIRTGRALTGTPAPPPTHTDPDPGPDTEVVFTRGFACGFDRSGQLLVGATGTLLAPSAPVLTPDVAGRLRFDVPVRLDDLFRPEGQGASGPVLALLRHLARTGAVRFQEPAVARTGHPGGSR